MGEETPERKTRNLYDFQDIYPNEFLHDIFPRLSESKPEKWEAFKETVFRAANMYWVTKNSAEGRTKPSDETKALQKLTKSTQSTRNIYLKTSEMSLPISIRIAQGLAEAKPEAYRYALPEFRTFLDLIVPPGNDEGKGTNLTLAGDILNFLRDAFEFSVDLDNIRQTDTKNTAVILWVSIIDEKWSDFSNMKLSLGRHDEEYGYTTHSLDILGTLMGPLDPKVKRSQIESSLKKVIANRTQE